MRDGETPASAQHEEMQRTKVEILDHNKFWKATAQQPLTQGKRRSTDFIRKSYGQIAAQVMEKLANQTRDNVTRALTHRVTLCMTSPPSSRTLHGLRSLGGCQRNGSDPQYRDDFMPAQH
jgi:hypothetical protein